MYANLKAEMARKGLSCGQLGGSIGCTEDMFSNRLRGKTRFTLEEAKAIQRQFFPECTIEYLYDAEVR